MSRQVWGDWGEASMPAMASATAVARADARGSSSRTLKHGRPPSTRRSASLLFGGPGTETPPRSSVGHPIHVTSPSGIGHTRSSASTFAKPTPNTAKWLEAGCDTCAWCHPRRLVWLRAASAEGVPRDGTRGVSGGRRQTTHSSPECRGLCRALSPTATSPRWRDASPGSVSHR